MDITWDSAQLISRAHKIQSLPEEVLQILQTHTDGEYLNTLSTVALRPAFTSTIFTTHASLFVEICSRWLVRPELDKLSALSALSGLVSLRPHLSVFARELLQGQGNAALAALASRNSTALQDISTEKLHDLLLAIYRLLLFENTEFAEFVAPAQMQSLLAHDARPIRYLAVRSLCLYLHASDAASMQMIRKYLGEDAVQGRWEDKTIDYTFLSLWEDKRLKDLARQSKQEEDARHAQEESQKTMQSRRVLRKQDLTATSACIGGVLIPRLVSSFLENDSMVMTETTYKDLKALAQGINSGRPLLLTGFGGCGKTSMIRHTARILGKDSSMVTLHLNEQTDAKLLIGMYTNSRNPGSFTWQPGVLTKAVKDGRWVVIEDLDRAPPEILSALIPLLERRELFIPNWGENIRAASGFKLIATVRSYENMRGEEIDPTANLLGRRLWSNVAIGSKPDNELATIIQHKSPILHAYISRMLAVYAALKNAKTALGSSTRVGKPASPRDLLRWSARVEDLLLAAGATSGSESISEATSDDIFLEAVDCFAAALPTGPAKAQIVDIIAQNLQMPLQRVQYCLETRVPAHQESEAVFSIGRARLHKRRATLRPDSMKRMTGTGPFAITDHVSRIFESVAATVKRAEPCLLVGETGTGKTTIVQRLASALNYRLIVVNLSQQSEAGDLLGGFKPVNMRNLAMPLREEFDDLLHLTFPSKTNQQYSTILEKAISKGRWARALSLWQEALRSIESHFETVLALPESGTEGPRSKKRKVRTTSYQQLKSRWNKFANDVQTFQKHLSSESKGFAFTFVEGSIVKAARNGDWVLLDEINLASIDTLESLTDLFGSEQDGNPSLLLSETGDIERIQAHKDFRIFGAMNPATDAGKRDLPPNIRSRFSEFFVEAPDQDLSNLVPVVTSYLGDHGHADVRLATDIAQLYLEIKCLANDNKLADGTDQKAHFSLRTLTRTLSYALDIAPVYGMRRALFEGFCMSFLTVLNNKSEMLLHPLIDQYILGSQKNRQAILKQTPRMPQDGNSYVRFKHYLISQGGVPVEEQSHYVITPFIERNLLNLVRATSTRKFPVLLQGPTSSGKTSMIEHLAKVSGNKFIRINNHEHTDLQEYLGSYVSGPDGHLHYQEGLLVQALREGSWIVLDELNLAPTDVLEALNRLLDDNRELFIPETQQVLRPHDNFMLFATQNPPGLYGGRKVLSRAFRNRFLELHFDDIPEDELETILRERSQIAPSFCKRLVLVYQRLSILRQTTRLFEQRNSFATLRDLFRWALRDADDREQLAFNGFLLLAERVRNADERLVVKEVIEDVMKVKISENQIYGLDNLKNLLGSPLPAPQGIIWTKSMRRLYVLVTCALKNNEPVLLVGETGSGKTTICQAIAEITNTKLHMVNAHQNMETGDLIGAQRPIRDKVHAKSQLYQNLVAALTKSGLSEVSSQDDLETLMIRYESLLRDAPDKFGEEVVLKIERSRTRMNALFEWSDGSLVQAMREGHHYLLDEISLADDSVLERLNSVLEPGRSLTLAEKGTTAAFVVASTNFQFLATMNPGGDYGKRELSPALRNRFTEIWVPNINDEDEMLEIIQAKLPSPLVDLAKPMVDFAAWYAFTYNAHMPSISIRDLLAWAQFVVHFQGAHALFCAFHGAAMVYLDGIGANPAARASMVAVDGSVGPRACLQKLSELFAYDMESLYGVTPALAFDDNRLQIGDFSLAKASNEASELQYSLQAPTTRLNAMKIVRALQLQKPILLEGSPGVGKTTLISALAHAIGMPLTRINLSDQTDLMDLFGSDVPLEGEAAGHFGWRDAPFLRAMQNGEWVLLDEMNLASQTVLEGLNACLDHRGQVYLSELDRSFSRHPNFVVFAAQNPHSQGGGRKGLPASFINRFTVVYAEAFSPQDLQVICRELYPTVSDDIAGELVRCVSMLSSHLRKDARLEAHGGPWEFNLRDILRWLQLMTSQDGFLRLGNPADFANLLIVQRFRTPEDRATISKILGENLPQIEAPRNYYHAQDSHALQVGLAILPKDTLSQPLSGSVLEAGNTNLPAAESMMLCVQKSWPCLLVGASGSGKTTAIQRLAAAIGADLVNISLNSEMDTMDLLGGFEQLDTKREITDFVKRLQAYTRKFTAQQLISAARIGVQRPLEPEVGFTSDLPDLLQRLQSAVQTHPSSDYPTLLREYQRLLQQTDIDNRARFEWVDGILVKALKQGKWLVLDNANLCNPSVLDRLNSLLEPNGSLSINEHRHPDGSARVLKPHPEFRLFMTMDPRHGELSRAMRNRSVELFMPILSPSSSPTVDVFGAKIEPAISHFQYSQVFDWNTRDDTQFFNVMSICLQHLSFSDFSLCNRWQAQVLLGLTNVPPSRLALFQSMVSIYQDLLNSNHDIINNIQNLYGAMSDELGQGQDFGALQTIHPFNNPIILSARNPSVNQLQYLGHCLDLIIELRFFEQKLKHVAEGMISKTTAMMTRLERSLSLNITRTIKNDSTQNIAGFLQNMGSYLTNTLAHHSLAEIARSQEFPSFAQEVLNYVTDLLDLTNSAAFDEGIFQTFQTLGRSLGARAVEPEDTDGPHNQLAKELSSKLGTFSRDWQLYTGLAMQELWIVLKPPTATSLDQLETSLEIEALADRFDTLKWRSGASLQELGVIRDSLLAIHSATNIEDPLCTAALNRVKEALESAERQSHLSGGDIVPFFQVQFEILAQISMYEDSSNLGNGRGVLEVLTGKPTKTSMAFESASQGWEALSQLQLLTESSRSASELGAIRQVLPISTLHKLSELDSVPLSSLSLLTAETDLLSYLTTSMCGVMSSEPVQHMDKKLKDLRLLIVQSPNIQEILSQPEKYLPSPAKLFKRLNGWNANQEGEGCDNDSELLEYSSSVFTSPESILDNQHKKTMIEIAEDWIQFFTGLLLLYVPDKPFDPALRPFVERDRHKKRTIELRGKMEALCTFEKAFSGQISSYRVHLVREALSSLGAEPQLPSILRPNSPELSLLQSEFNTILTSIVLRLPRLYTLETANEGRTDREQEIELSRTNIRKAILRLESDYRAYDDLKKPVVSILQGLDVGLSLLVLASTQMGDREEVIADVCQMTPFMGAGSQTLIHRNFNDVQKIRYAGFDPRKFFLERVALVRCVDSHLAEEPMRTMLETFHSFYRDWKEKLDQDQKENAAKSSLYRYRGSEEDGEEFDKEDFERLFPTYGGHVESDRTSQKSTPYSKVLAQRVSSLHREIFQNGSTATQRIIDVMENASMQIAHLWSEESRTSTSPVAAENILCPLILNLGKATENLQVRTQQDNSYNFYTDANIVEAQKIVALVHSIQARFRALRDTWPEHATLEDVLKISRELLSLRHSEPIAKVLTKAEQLHSFVHEWQTVASREFTAVNLYDQLTDLIVSWRRLELSTWGRLLDMEDTHCKDDSKSWWFIAYEVIIAAPISIINNHENIVSYAEQLFSTLETFLATTSLGQYSYRLQMLKGFEGHVTFLAKEHQSLTAIRNTLANFLRYYHRYEDPVQQSLSTGRKKIVKEMKEILLLASWKDTNIIALRDSAKRSHHKLFKVVRKYRTLLSQPAESVLVQGSPELSDEGDRATPEYLPIVATMVDVRALEICQKKLLTWADKPIRLTTPNDTTQNMLRISQLPSFVLNGSAYLHAFASELIDDIKTLQKETPTKATKHNSETIKHLKSRKRKLYSETLKALRQMGFRSHLSADVLKKQDSTAAVMSSSPFFGDSAPQDLAQADLHFDCFMSIMPQTRELATKHSEDLSHSEAVRSLGYLESMLSVIVKQREILCRSFNDVTSFEATCCMMGTLWAPDRYMIQVQDANSEKHENDISRVMRWLPSILDVGCIIIGTYGKSSGVDSSKAIQTIKTWQSTIRESGNMIDGLARLPSGVSSTQHAHVFASQQQLMGQLRSELRSMATDSPNLAFVYKQIEIWTAFGEAGRKIHTNGTQKANPSQVDEHVSKAMNSIFVALQHMNEALSSAPSTDQGPRWLFHLDTSLSNSLESLRSRMIERMLHEAMSQIQHLHISDPDNFQIASAICGVAMPVVQQYHNIQRVALDRYAKFHLHLCRLASILAKSFSQVAQQGFCNPAEDSASKQESTEKLEGGTGLGEGEGVEDISKDIQDDEDLSELAQQNKKEEDKPEIEDQDNAVDMDHDELEGELSDASDKSDDGEDSSDGSVENDIEDETGDVDDLDPGAVDEKLWDGKGEDDRREKEGDNARGEAGKDQSAATENGKNENDEGETADEEAAREEEESQDGADEGEDVARKETEKMDSHAQEGQNLDLPEEMDLDDNDGSQGLQSEDDEMDKLSDVNANEENEGKADQEDDGEHEGLLDDDNSEQPDPQGIEKDQEEEQDAKEGSRAESPADTEPEDDNHDDHDDHEGFLQNRTDDAVEHTDDVAPSDAQGLDQGTNQAQDNDQQQRNKAQGSKGAESASNEETDAQAAVKSGETSQNLAESQGERAEDDRPQQDQPIQSFKKLGDALEDWHRQQRQIREATSPARQDSVTAEVNIEDQDVEHLRNGEEEADTQALGAASKDQARPLDDTAVDTEMKEEHGTFAAEDKDEESPTEENQNVEDAQDLNMTSENPRDMSRPGAFVGKDARSERQNDQPNAPFSPDREEFMAELDNELSLTHLQPPQETYAKSIEEARRLWAHYEVVTRDLSLFLTERLRLILAPTRATKMRGDFRTGKRLNIKRIIPYIASNFRRDKIWMRRSIPSKRNYQIMLAVDDSKSMSESGSGQLAYQTLTLVAKSLSMLEAGEICILGFGNDVFVTHEFDQPFSSEAGATVLQRFNFQQEGTNVRKLVAESIKLFRQARLKQSNSSQDLWQLELIISDGVCEDHETIKRMIRQATEERIMIVFVIVDALRKEESIVDMNQAVFEPDAATGETKLKIQRYLDGFPFTYYLIVGDVRELPSVLAQALRQWFTEVVES